VVALLIANGAAPHATTVHGATALSAATSRGHDAVALLLKQNGATQ
jgi:ankyrin repeat protein